MPILCYGSQSPISNRIHALTSFVLPDHSLGVSYASERGQSPKLNVPLTSDPSAEIPIVSTQHPIWADVNCVISLTHRTILQKERCPPFQTPTEGGRRAGFMPPPCQNSSSLLLDHIGFHFSAFHKIFWQFLPLSPLLTAFSSKGFLSGSCNNGDMFSSLD